MRSPAISLLFLAIACSGNSLKVGSDDSENGGGSGDDSGSVGTGGNGRGGAKATSGGSNATSGGSPAVGANGGTSSGAEAGEAGTAGVTAGVGGVDPGGGTGATGGSVAGPPITSCTDQFPFMGEWLGNILDYFFEPVEELSLSVRAQAGAGGYVGELTWGSGDPPPPATDPDAPYPPGLDFGGIAGSSGQLTEPWPGLPYEVVRGAGCDASFRVNVSVYATWESWCELQEPVYTEGQGWGCTYQGGGSSDGTTCQVQDGRGNVVAEYPQWKCDLCGWARRSVCACDEFGCTANREPTHSFDLTLSESGGVDVLSGPGPDTTCSDCTVRLERQ